MSRLQQLDSKEPFNLIMQHDMFYVYKSNLIFSDFVYKCSNLSRHNMQKYVKLIYTVLY